MGTDNLCAGQLTVAAIDLRKVVCFFCHFSTLWRQLKSANQRKVNRPPLQRESEKNK